MKVLSAGRKDDDPGDKLDSSLDLLAEPVLEEVV